MLGASDGYARFVAHRLVRKGWLERLRPGLYQLVPASRGTEAVADWNPLAVGAVLVEPYFFSFGTACTHHGFTEQVFAEVYMACRVRHPPQLVRGKRYVFVYEREQRFFGFEPTSVLGQPVLMATPERALLDALDRPQYAGGIGEVSRVVGKAALRISWPKLLRMARLWNESAIVQRLGHLLDLHRVEISDAVRSKMLRLTQPGNKVLLGPRRSWGTTGRLDSTWGIIQSVPAEVLMESGTRRRKIKLGPKRASRDR
ncbi:MAG: type IV toxin-antitoxin system AbiEi family antitoxin domain-containing protein [Deltaproteobacteria bacterium]|nr:type IV toxin-antitoxin system AbiEi family antitoxin domain-containing protein [Deltaproteobacteria bacterium]